MHSLFAAAMLEQVLNASPRAVSLQAGYQDLPVKRERDWPAAFAR